jgi:exodeoxyribonuclease VII small subunit
LTGREHECKLAAAFEPADYIHFIMAEPQTPPVDFERSLTELEALVEKLEQGDLSLDESLKCFERGVQLTRICQTALKQAEQKVEILLRRSGDPEQFDRANFDSEADDEA